MVEIWIPPSLTAAVQRDRLGPPPVLIVDTARVDGVLTGCSPESASLGATGPPSPCLPNFSPQCYPDRMPFFCSSNRWSFLHTCASWPSFRWFVQMSSLPIDNPWTLSHKPPTSCGMPSMTLVDSFAHSSCSSRGGAGTFRISSCEDSACFAR